MAIQSRLKQKIEPGASHFADVNAVGLEMTVYQCGSCDMVFGLTDAFVERRRNDKASFFCPWCKVGFSFTGESETERLRRELEQVKESRARETQRANANRDLLRQEERSHAATKGVATKRKKEIERMHVYVGAGTCPVPGCRRHFQDLDKHMKTKHEGWTAEA